MLRRLPPRLWRSTCTGKYTCARDARGLLRVTHPWACSTNGRSGQWSVTASPPPGWKSGRPLYVSFYQSDNYSGSRKKSLDDAWQRWVGSQVFIGHRFKQLLVNGQLAWESDVADEELAGSIESFFRAGPGKPGYLDPYRVVDISRYAGPRIEFTFRVVDKVPSTVKLPGDFYKRFDGCFHDPHLAQHYFHTQVWFGDVVLATERSAALTGQRFAAPTGWRGYKGSPEVLCSRAAPPARQRGVRRIRSGIPLTLTAESLPKPGFPVRCGVPLPQGAVRPNTRFAIENSARRSIPLAVTELAHWPDGSVQWLLCEFIASRKGRYRLLPGRRTARPARPVRIRTRDRKTTVTNGLVRLRIGKHTGPGVFDELSSPAGARIGPMDLAIRLNRVGWTDRFAARRRKVTVEKTNGICAVVRIDGDMLGDNKRRFGAWRARLEVWADLPYLLCDWRLVNESEHEMAVLLNWAAEIPLPEWTDAMVDFGPFAPDCVPAETLYPLAYDPEGHAEFSEKTLTLKPQLLLPNTTFNCVQELAGHARVYKDSG